MQRAAFGVSAVSETVLNGLLRAARNGRSRRRRNPGRYTGSICWYANDGKDGLQNMILFLFRNGIFLYGGMIMNMINMNKKKRILTGDRPTGRLHLGHFVGSLQNRVKLQDEYDTFVLLADVQALTTHFKDPALIRESIFQVAADNLSVGLDPEKVTFVQQSMVPSIAELTVFFSMFVSLNTLRHNPTVKTEAKQYGLEDLTYGFLGYPVSQSADIVFLGAELVPVGEDQLPHLEQARKIVRRFNDLYGNGERILTEPSPLLSDTPRLCGLDGNAKMGKSLNNAIYLSDDRKAVAKKIQSAVTDTGRIRVSDKGNPDVCTINKYIRAFMPEEYPDSCQLCREAKIGCAACKRNLTDRINGILEPVREKRRYYEQRRSEVTDIIAEGTKRANLIGGETVHRVKKAMNLVLEV